MSLSFAWSRTSKHAARFRMEMNEQIFEFEGTDSIDSLGEFAEAASSVILESHEAQVAFENEPGQHILSLAPIGDGRVQIDLSWVANPYGMLGKNDKGKKLCSGKVPGSEFITAILSLLNTVKKQCDTSQFTLGMFKFPEAAFERLKNA